MLAIVCVRNWCQARNDWSVQTEASCSQFRARNSAVIFHAGCQWAPCQALEFNANSHHQSDLEISVATIRAWPSVQCIFRLDLQSGGTTHQVLAHTRLSYCIECCQRSVSSMAKKGLIADCSCLSTRRFCCEQIQGFVLIPLLIRRGSNSSSEQSCTPQ